jgi:hypothetical protein
MKRIKEIVLNLIIAFLIWLPIIIAFEYAYN